MRYMKVLQERIQSVFYTHGLFCASHPIAIISLVITIVLITCYPLTRLPLPGNAPLEYSTPVKGYTVPPPSPATPLGMNEEQDRARWFMGTPTAYIQQIIVKAVVSPWDSRQHIQTDAFRAPLTKAFDIMQQINAFQYKSNESVAMSISDVCLHVHETLKSKMVKGLVPEYNCLVVSPANLWGMDRTKFDEDGQIMKTVFKQYGPVLDTPPSIRGILFGVPMKDSGIKRFFIRNRQRVISFAVTLVFQKYNSGFVAALRQKLESVYAHVTIANITARYDRMDHLFFKDVNYFVEYTPLMVVYILAFLYLYFSVLKFDMVKSKWGLAFAAVMTVLASLLMSVGICAFFGMTPSLHGRNFGEMFPYLVVAIGVENIVVITTSVVTTPVHLDVKLRVAQGISKEGWRIFKTFMTWMLILLCGFLTFSPAIQEFALVAVVALLSDFFLQIFFFLSVLSIDIRRMELSDLQRKSVQRAIHEETSAKQQQQQGVSVTDSVPPLINPVKSKFARQPETIGQASLLSGGSDSSRGRRSSSPPPSPSTGSPKDANLFFPSHMWRTPRRVRLFNFWARYRVAQRGMMVCMVIWIMLILHKAGIVEHVFHVGMSWANISSYSYSNSKKSHLDRVVDKEPTVKQQHVVHDVPASDPPVHLRETDASIQELLQHNSGSEWRNLYYMHYPTLLSYYNISVRGKYITMLPSIHLSIVIPSEEAFNMRHQDEIKASSHLSQNTFQHFNSETSLVEDEHDHTYLHDGFSPPKTDPHDPNLTSHQVPTSKPLNLTMVLTKLIRYPQTEKEYVVTVLLGVASLIVFTYFMTQCYKCMCSRNYHKWRTSWARNKRRNRQARYYKQIRDAVPFVLEGHQQEVECLTTDGPLVVSSCLGGEIHVWDSMCGERLTVIRRKGYEYHWSPIMPRKPIPGRNINDSDADLYAEYHEQGARFSGSGSNGKNSTPPSRNSLNSTPPEISHLKPLASLDTQIEAPLSPETSPMMPLTPHEVRHKMSPTSISANSGLPISSPHHQYTTRTISHASQRTFGLDSFQRNVASPVQRQHSHTGHVQQSRVRQQHARNKSTDWNWFVDQVPDLSTSIETDFTSLYKHSTSQQHGQVTNRQQSHDTSHVPTPSSSANEVAQSTGSPTCQSVTASHSQPVLSSHTSEPRLDSSSSASKTGSGFDFSHFDTYYQEHRLMLQEKDEYLRRRNLSSARTRSQDEDTFQMDEELFNLEEDSRSTNTGSSEEAGKGHRRSWSFGSINGEVVVGLAGSNATSQEDVSVVNVAPPIWCLACKDNLIVAATGDGRVEFWDGLTGNLKCIYHKNKVGATAVSFVGNKVIVARLNGSLDFLELETFMNVNRPAPPLPTNFLQHRGQIKRVLSQPGLSSEMRSWDDEIHCTLISTNKAHQRSINLLQCEVGRVVTASQDHTLKVFRLEDQLCLFTLHGHKAAVTALHLDKVSPYAAASGSEDGTVRLWDMLTGTCIHMLQGHGSAVTALTCTEMYVVSTGLDDRLCIWERCKGHRIHWIQMEAGYCNSLTMITSNLMVTGGQGCLYMWDVSKGEVLRVVQLGEADDSVFIRQIIAISNSVVCDYGNQLRVIYFPAVLETKSD